MPEPRVEYVSDCWLWRGAVASGYPVFTLAGKQEKVHRVVYQIWHGAIPGGFDVHHSCGNPLCVRPEHLQALASADHRAEHARSCSLWCPKGHRRTAATVMLKPTGYIHCKLCYRASPSYQRALVERRVARGRS